jgi:NADPH-ferrihemoprotein reductase
MKNIMKENFELIVAFSREGPQKVYVQDRLREKATTVHQLLQQKAHFYVCGDAKHMAADVGSTLRDVLVEQRGVTIDQAKDTIQKMKASKQYQVRGGPERSNDWVR